jgi:hypothetical protein
LKHEVTSAFSKVVAGDEAGHWSGDDDQQGTDLEDHVIYRTNKLSSDYYSNVFHNAAAEVLEKKTRRKRFSTSNYPHLLALKNIIGIEFSSIASPNCFFLSVFSNSLVNPKTICDTSCFNVDRLPKSRIRNQIF